jgi:hypothetical protein
MKTTVDIVDILWQHADGSSLKTAITGKVYKSKRPIDSKVEDVVINSLPVLNRQLQVAIANVNVYVPNKAVTINGAVDSSQPDTKRLKELATIATTVFEEGGSAGYEFLMEQQHVMEDEGSNSHYINLRIIFYNENL